MKAVRIKLMAFSCKNVVKSVQIMQTPAKFWQPSWFLRPLWKSKLISTNVLRFPIIQNINLGVYNINL